MDITCINKKRLKDILLVLFPEYQSISIQRSGLIVFRKSKWSRSKFIQTLDGLCYQYLPSRLSVYLNYECDLPFVYNDPNFLIEYIYQLILRRKRPNIYKLESINNDLNITINSLLMDNKRARLNNKGDIKQTLKLFKLSNKKEKSIYKIKLGGFSLLK